MTALTREDERVYGACMRRFGPLDDRALREGLSLVRVQTLDKGRYLLRAGERARETAVVVTGLLHASSVARGVRAAHEHGSTNRHPRACATP